MKFREILSVRKKSFLFCATDAGAGLFMSQIILKLQKKNKVSVFLGDKAAIANLNKPIKFQLYSKKRTLKESAKYILKNKNYDFIFVGTNLGASVEKEIVRINKNKIYTISIIDHIWNPWQRFYDYKIKKENVFITNKIYVISDQTKKILIDKKIEKQRIETVEHPYLRGLRDKKILKKPNLKLLGIPTKSKIIVYASEPPPKFDKNSNLREIKLNEIEKKFRNLVETLNKLKHKKIFLIIKKHPTEKKYFLNNEIKKLNINYLSIKSELSVLEILSISDLCIGLSSMMLLESLSLNIKTVTLHNELYQNVNKISMFNKNSLKYINSKKEMFKFLECNL